MIALTYALAGAGLAVAVWAAWTLIQRSIHTEVAANLLVKLSADGNLQRIVKLCAAAPNTVLDGVKRAAIAGGALSGRDRVTVEAAVLPAYDEETKRLAATWINFTQYGLFGAAMLGGSFILAQSEDALHQIHYGASIAAAIFAIYFMVKRGQFAVAVALMRDKVVTKIVDGLVGGGLAPDKSQTSALAEQPGAELTITVLRDGVQVATVTTTKTVIKIGRTESSQVVLQDDDVARMHAIIERTGEAMQIIDLGSSKGTSVNGVKANKSDLRAGDIVEIGPFKLEFR